ncbi:ABC transporter permease [Corynebacterium bovis]|uniref:Peptide ABC transporter permease n=1 Tax=Corynebacterium bovis TaxID=36808 RepID=A0A3R8PHZ0_9CORY|nr:ABC transporter permease [Corynebacterium bovis]MDN8578371.1 ABC transporter permease [Corynebacterium bovis]RRO87396.1 peptide ABC transporter permease [Corynebacterium bovis]RRO90516.1 peptide ABC transporter permease [Corynebacterium bovis]
MPETTTPRTTAPRGFWGGAWVDLRRRPMFWVAVVIIVAVLAVAVAPGLFAHTDPRAADLHDSLEPARSGHPFGFTQQGYDVYARTVYGARASVVTGVLTTVAITVLGVLVGAVAGYLGGWVDAVLSRVTDIFFAIPLLLAGIVLMQMFTVRTTWTVVLVLSAFGWPQMARIVRGAVLSAKTNDYVLASRALGLSRTRILTRHILPNCLAPIIVMATTSLGIYIVAEATLSYLGIGLPPTTVSWGNDISTAQSTLRIAPQILFYPAGALAVTVLGFILLGDTLKDSLDPKERTR